MIHYAVVDTPIGDLLATSDVERLTGLRMAPFDVDPEWSPDVTPLRDAVAQLHAYFAGELRDFDLELGPHGTEFQMRAWAGLRTIPYGRTITYTELARRIGSPRAARAVGGANGANPIAIIIPCHRVIGANGTLTGFGGGLWRKEALLRLETSLEEMVTAPSTVFPRE